MENIKRSISSLLLVLILLTGVFGVTAFAQELEDCAGAFEYVCKYEESTGCTLTDYVGFGVKLSNTQIGLFTYAPPDGSIWTFGDLPDSQTLGFYQQEATQESGEVYLYLKENDFSDYGAEYGFVDTGTLKQNEKVTVMYVTYDEQEGGYVVAVIETTAVSQSGDQLTLSDYPADTLNGPGMILNSSNLLCGYFGKDGAYSMVSEEDFYGSASGSGTAPASTATPAPTAKPSEGTSSSGASDSSAVVKKASDLPTLEYVGSSKKETPVSTIILCTIPAALAIILLVVFLIVRKKKKNALEPVEEGTRLAYDMNDTGLTLRFSNGMQTRVNRSITIGREQNNSVVISAQAITVSGHHCEVVTQNGRAYLIDNSRNGCYINNMRTARGQQTELQRGARVYLGQPNGTEYFDVV